MKMASSLFLLAAFTGCFAGATQVESQGIANTPVSRAVQLLKGMVLKTEMMQKMEQGLFDKYVCWAKTIMSQKTASNEAAEARIDVLETYIANIDAGRIDFTTERVDLEKAIAGLKEDIETATALRNEENENFLAAEEEMEAAIAALDKAISVLGKATANHKTGVLLAQHEASESLTFASRSREVASLQRAVKLGKQVLGAGDAIFLERLLTGDVPTWDWKKLNRKATFKMSYKARSFKIQEVLQNMQSTFSENLVDAQATEKSSQGLYDKLMKSKNGELSRTEKALDDMAAEAAARGMTKQESQDEIDALKTQVKDDTRFIKQTKDSLKEKTRQWGERKKLRAEEIMTMNQAIAILHNDDARDLMKKSFASQGYSFLQEVMSSHAIRTSRASSLLQQAARSSGDARLASVAAQIAQATPLTDNSPFAAVIRAINSMISLLKAEEDSDLKEKEQCEEDRMHDTREAIVKARDVDDKTEAIDKLRAEIAEITQEIAELKEKIQQTKDELAKAKQMREDEHAEFVASDKDDHDAHETVTRAKAVLEKFYSDNMLTAFAQVPAGEAPLPPPRTWDTVDDYSKQGAFGRKSIITMLDGILEDIAKDITQSQAEEDAAQTAFDAFEKESLAQIGKLQQAKSVLVKIKAGKENNLADNKKLRGTGKSELDVIMQTISDAEPFCDYVTINYPIKLRNRQVELDGLTKAKAILVGGTFNAGPDPNREIKPGDAF